MAVTSVTRMDAVMKRDTRPLFPIPSEIFGGPNHTPSAYWGKEIPETLKEAFWQNLGPELRGKEDVSCGKVFLLAEALRDAREEPVPTLGGVSGEVALFFVDPDPLANWAHPCFYVLLRPDGQVLARGAHHLPPSESIPLAPTPRPSEI